MRKNLTNYMRLVTNLQFSVYVLPKVHQPNVLCCHILSVLNTFDYNLLKLFVPFFNPISVNQYTIKNTFSFAEEVKNLNINQFTMASFDVVSMFTNILYL